MTPYLEERNRECCVFKLQTAHSDLSLCMSCLSLYSKLKALNELLLLYLFSAESKPRLKTQAAIFVLSSAHFQSTHKAFTGGDRAVKHASFQPGTILPRRHCYLLLVFANLFYFFIMFFFCFCFKSSTIYP